MTGPLSSILQGVNIDFGKALNLLDAAPEQLSKLRSDPQKIVHAVAEIFMESSGEKREFQEGDGYHLSLFKMNLQPLQKNSGDVRYSTQLLTPLLPE